VIERCTAGRNNLYGACTRTVLRRSCHTCASKPGDQGRLTESRGQHHNPPELAGAGYEITARNRPNWLRGFDSRRLLPPHRPGQPASRHQADQELAAVFGVEEGTAILRRQYETSERTGQRRARSVSYIPRYLVDPNPVLLSADCEPWPGGTQHQLYTVGIELDRIDDDVTATMPTTVEKQKWGMADGVPLLHVRRISIDTQDRVVEVSDAAYPADCAGLKFTTPLRRW
jgi:hypothetical protein